MKTSWKLATAAVAAGNMMLAGALATPPAGSGMAAPARNGIVRVQAAQSSEAVKDRIDRLWQHRAILESALQSPDIAGPSETLEPRARALRPPESVIVTAPQDETIVQELAGEGQVTCEAAAQIVADFGFSDIGTPDCSGDLYKFSAMRDGTAYAIGISAVTGEIAEVSRQ